MEPGSASFANKDRFTPVKRERPVEVTVDEQACPGLIIATNGPRCQVRFQKDGDSYLRWFDAAEVRPT